MTGEDFKGKVIPFGVKVFCKPTDTREKTYAGKFDLKGIPGIFAGYVITTGQQWSRKYKVWDMAEFAGVNLSVNAAVPRKLAQPYLTEVVVLPVRAHEFHLGRSSRQQEIARKRDQRLDGDDVDRPSHGGDDDDDDDDGGVPKGKHHHGIGDDPLDDYYKAIEALRDKVLERAEADAEALRAPTSSSTLVRADGSIPHDDVGPSGRLIPKGGEENPGDILRRLKDGKLVSDDVEHWSNQRRWEDLPQR